MSTTRPPLVRVRAATRPGNPKVPNEDRCFMTPNAVLILDGASQPEATEHDGGWLAETLGHELHQQLSLTPDANLVTTVEESIRTVADKFNLQPGTSPSTTVTIVRWWSSTIDVFVLGDSPVVALTTDNHVIQIRDDRLSHVARAERQALREKRGEPEHELRQRLVAAERRARNTAGGYWIAEAQSDAARHARTARLNRPNIAEILAMTDGVSVGVDRYHVPVDWPAAFAIARSSLEDLITTIHQAENEDSDRRRWARSKAHDDKTVAICRLHTSTSN